MALSFLTSTDITVEVVVTCDPMVTCTPEQRAKYLLTGKIDDLGGVDGATRFTLRALGPSEREAAEVRAGAYTRSELGRLLWVEAPDETRERAKWHHELSEDEREAMADYQSYLNRVYIEMVSASLQAIDDEPATIDQIQLIRPDDHRVQTISELVTHVQRLSLLGEEGK